MPIFLQIFLPIYRLALFYFGGSPMMDESKHTDCANQWLVEQTGNQEVLRFLQQFRFNLFSYDLPTKTASNVLKSQFQMGYC